MIRRHRNQHRGLFTLARNLGLNVQAGRESELIPATRRRTLRTWRPTLVVGIYLMEAVYHPRMMRDQVLRGLAHELGHFFAAAKGRRTKKNYGIREGHLSPRAREFWEIEEQRAVLVERHLLGLVKVKVRRLRRRLDLADSKYFNRIDGWWEGPAGEAIRKEIKKNWPLKSISMRRARARLRRIAK